MTKHLQLNNYNDSSIEYSKFTKSENHHNEEPKIQNNQQ